MKSDWAWLLIVSKVLATAHVAPTITVPKKPNPHADKPAETGTQQAQLKTVEGCGVMFCTLKVFDRSGYEFVTG